MAVDPYRYFRLEARELLDRLAEGVLALEKEGGNAGVVQGLLRQAHTLKGAARVVKQPEIADRAHAIEDVLAPLRDGAGEVPRERIDALLAHLDEIAARTRALDPPEEAKPGAPATPAREEPARTVRTDVGDVDAVLGGVAQTHALLGGLRSVAQGVEQSLHLADLLLEQLSRRGRRDDGSRSTAEHLRRGVAGIERRLGAAVDQMDRELRELRAAAEQLRLAPAGTLFTTLERTVRDAAQALGKQAVFVGSGGDIRLDADMLATIQAALVQIVRNAVAHGIEPERVRRAAAKPSAGRVTVDVSRRGRRIVFRCSDDGGGVDLDAVRRAASRRGLGSAEAQRLDAEELVRLLLRGGISTSSTVTEVSGRGVGLDVVREAVERLGGDCAIRTEAGAGTTFELVVPLSLASLETLVVEVAEGSVAIPLDAVRSAIRVAPGEVVWAQQGASVLFEGRPIPFVPLASTLYGTRPPAGQRPWSAIVVAGAGGLAAAGVDRLVGPARVVVRPLAELVPASAVVAGASLDAEGNPQLVLDPDGLVAEAQRGAAAPEPLAPGRPVLVVDDSLTTRILEQSILEAAGYEVDTASSAEEALETVRRKRYALILVDVEMPGMDGFSFVERIRADPALHDIPVILVTSRAAPEDRQRGRDAGADGYMVKSEFDQAALLEMIRPMMS